MTNEKLDSIPLRSTPQFYELWYRYFDGNPEIVREINSQPGPFDEIACQKIYNRYLSNVAHDDAVHKTGDKIQGSIVELTEMLKSAMTATADYGGQMSGVAEKVQKATNINELAGVVAEILAQTKQVLDKNQTLEVQLKQSYGQVNVLKKYLESAKKEATIDGLTGGPIGPLRD